MDILILADFCGQFDGKGNNRFIYLAELLSKEHSVEIVTSDFNHAEKKYFEKRNFNFSYKTVMLHEGKYKKNVCLARFRAHYVWGKNVGKYLKQRKKPDVIYCAIPTLKAAYEAGIYCKNNNIRFIIDVQDLWPEAFRMVFNVPLVSTFVFAPFNYLANKVYAMADEVCAVSQTYIQRVLYSNKKCKSPQNVFLGTELDTFDKYANKVCCKMESDDELKLAYCGTLGSSYDLKCVFDSLFLLKNRGIKLPKFVIMGDGPRKKEFEEYANNKGVYVEFKGNVPYATMCETLSRCDIVINPITHGAAQSIINKHADYAACGLPVLSTQECEEYRELVNEYHMGFNCKNNDCEDLANKMEILLKNKELRLEMGRNARKCAEEKFDRKSTYKKLVRLIENREFKE